MKIYHVTWVTHNSRVSERMRKYGIGKYLIPIILNETEEIEITEYILEMVIEDKLKIVAYNICKDHIHLIIVCDENSLEKIVQKLKAVSARKFNIAHGFTIPVVELKSLHNETIEQGSMLPCSDEGVEVEKKMLPCSKKKSRGKAQNQLWAQKFNQYEVISEEQLLNTYNYVMNNRIKHNLPRSKELEIIIQKMITPLERIYK